LILYLVVVLSLVVRIPVEEPLEYEYEGGWKKLEVGASGSGVLEGQNYIFL
jgi:hypothetical protein